MQASENLSVELFEATSQAGVDAWLRELERELGGIRWVPVGGIGNNVHTVEAASDPALALVERPTNSIDALLDLRARQTGESARNPHDAAMKWWGVPTGGLSAMQQRARLELADHIRVTMIESGTNDRPTIAIQDSGTGQHPDDFPATHVSLLASNKKGALHLMGVYNAGGAATYKFASSVIIASRLAPDLLDGRPDEVGVTAVRYNELDPNKFKSGVYEYLVAKDGSIVRLGIPALPDMPYGTYVKLIEYMLAKYARGAYEPKSSLWQLLHAALPDPALPFRIIETRDRILAGKAPQRRVVTGLLHLLGLPGTAGYSDERTVGFKPEVGKIVLRYYVLNEGKDPSYYATSSQAVTITLNGQRHIVKDRMWLRRHTSLYYLHSRLLVVVDGTGLTNATKREVFSSTRESGVDSPLARHILDTVVQELTQDENLYELDERAKQQALDAATKSTTEKVKKQLASEIAAYLTGEFPGKRGGGRKPTPRKRKPKGNPQDTDDSSMLQVPDRLTILRDPVEIQQGHMAALLVEINAKNGFLPKYGEGLSVVIGPELNEHIQVRSKGRLLGGRVRVTLEASLDAPIAQAGMKVALVVEELGVLLIAEGTIKVIAPKKPGKEPSNTGGAPDVEVKWVRRDAWDQFAPPWDAETVGDCLIYRDDENDPAAITRVEWVLNECFAPYEYVIEHKKLGEVALRTFREGYEYPVCFGLFRQRLAEEAKEKEADEEGRQIEIPDDYVRGERARLARAILMAKEPDLRLAQLSESQGG